MPREIAVAFYTDASELGGAELSLGNLLAALSPGVEATVVGTNTALVARLAACRPGTQAVAVRRVRSVLDLGGILAHARAFRRIGPDVVHISLNHPWASTWAQLAAIATPGARVVLVEQLPRPPRRRRDVVVKRLLARNIDAHVVVGDRSAKELARLTRLSGPLTTIYNGVQDVSLDPMPRASAGFVVGSLGRLHAQKGYDVLVRALGLVEGVKAVVVGEGEEREALLRLADDLGLRDRLLLPGWSDDARRYLTSFDAFVLPSRFEAFPLSIVEAMLAGLPVVASNVGSVVEAVIDGSTGILVPPDDPRALADALGRLAGGPPLRTAMGARGRKRALRLFTADAMAARFEALYDEVLARP